MARGCGFNKYNKKLFYNKILSEALLADPDSKYCVTDVTSLRVLKDLTKKIKIKIIN